MSLAQGEFGRLQTNVPAILKVSPDNRMPLKRQARELTLFVSLQIRPRNSCGIKPCIRPCKHFLGHLPEFEEGWARNGGGLGKLAV